jgi:hypothetical protein
MFSLIVHKLCLIAFMYKQREILKRDVELSIWLHVHMQGVLVTSETAKSQEVVRIYLLHASL